MNLNASEPSPARMTGLLIAFAAVWATYLSVVNAPFPVLHDMTEAYVWGREFQFGYNQHPPFWAWICGAWFLVFPREGWAFALLGVVNATVGLAGAWALIGDFASGSKRIAAFALLLLTPFYTFGCYKYDANTIFLSIWPWTMHGFVRSLRETSSRTAVGFGIGAGIALMSKYYAALLLAACLLGALATPERARYFKGRAPYLSGLVALAILAPHLIWLAKHEAPPLRYLSHISGRGFAAIAVDVGKTALDGALSNLAVVAVVAWFLRPAPALLKSYIASRWADPDFRLLTFLALAPFALTLFAGLALQTKLTPEMSIATFALVPLLTIEVCGAERLEPLASASQRLAVGFSLLMLVASPAIMLGRAWAWSHADDVSPHQEIAVEATRIWREKTGRPLAFVAGHGFENPVVFYSPDRGRSFYDFDFSKNLWVTPTRLAKYGLLTVCLKDDADCLAETAKFLTPPSSRTELTLAHRFWRHIAKPYTFIVTVIPPRTCGGDGCAGAAD